LPIDLGARRLLCKFSEELGKLILASGTRFAHL